MLKIKRIKALYGVVRYFGRKYNEQSLGAYSAQAAFFIFIALFPFAILLFNIISNLPIGDSEFAETVLNVLPSLFGQILNEAFDQAQNASNVTVIIISSVSALWASSKGMQSIIKGLNASNDTRESRNFIRLRVNAAFYTLIFVVVIIATLGLLVFGNIIYDWLINMFPNTVRFAMIIKTFRFLALLVILMFLFILMYKFLPNKKLKYSQTIPGAAISSFGWLAFSYVYSMYMNKTDMSSSVYGSLAAIVFLMLWLYFCMSIFLFGALFNATLDNS